MTNPRTVLHNVNIFDSINGKIEEDKTIVISKGKIDWVGEASSFEKEQNDTIMDLEGKYALPGLIDCHVHLELRSEHYTNPYQEWATTSPYFAGFRAIKSAEDHIRSGFTTVRDCGGDLWGQSLNRAIAGGLYRGPRVLAAQWPLQQVGSITYDLPMDLNVAFNWLDSQRVLGIAYPTGVDEMILAVRTRRMQGSSFIKVMNTGSVYGLILGSNIEDTFFSAEEMDALANEAHRNGMHVACHSHNDTGINEALDAGIDTIEHASYISEETSKRMAKTDSYLITTYLVGDARHSPEKMKENPGFVELMNEVAKATYENHRVAFEEGVKFALGSDSGPVNAPPGSSAKELVYIVENLGMSPAQALQCATINAARAIKLEDEIGFIEVGKVADIVVVGVNPLESLTSLQELENIEYVLKGGEIVSKRGILQ
ncbi:amidohydrolase family protein [Candidatus Thorarchaeota archaeon]|nr:MAG: amidohydrolase family protein [Candidatus Thorarchaeota archaeon]